MDLRLSSTLTLALPLALVFGGRATIGSREATPASPAFAADDTIPGWRATGHPPAVLFGRDTVEKHGGSASGHLVSHPELAGSLVNSGQGGRGGGGGRGGQGAVVYFAQALNAKPYRDRRVRLSLWVRTRLPDKPAPKMPTSQVNTYMRFENEDGTYTLYDGNVSPLFGNAEWTRKFIVMEVPPDAYSVVFGVALTGPGEVWVDDVVFEDQGTSGGSFEKKPMMPPERMAQMTPEQQDRMKEIQARAITRMAERPTELVNGDFETK